MSYEEYHDLYEKCQSYAPYQMFIYDLMNSKKIIDKDRQQKLRLLINTTYDKIKKLEKIQNKKILHQIENNDNISYLEDPFLIDGDTIGFTVLRNQITANTVDLIFENVKKELNISYEFHKANGYYETDKYELGNILYFRGYLIQELNTKHKRLQSKHL